MSRSSEKKVKSKKWACDACHKKKCDEGKDCSGQADEILQMYEGENLKLATAASKIESKYYMQKTRLEEIILFSKEMSYRKLGIAFCIGLAEEAEILSKFIRRHFEVVSVCCKVCGIQKETLNLEKIGPDIPESMCNPIGQAVLLNQAKTDLNLICGLCMGHDILFTKHSEAPVSTFIVKDRVLAHNPVASLTCRYLRKRMEKNEK
ncbi:MAG: DUF1847 domain-containing protein [bacterium]